MKFFMEFHGKNFMKKIRQMFMKNFIEFHEMSMKFHGILPRNSMKLRMMEFYGIPWNSMKFREFMEFCEIRFREGKILSDKMAL
jgi:hypothetical protein